MFSWIKKSSSGRGEVASLSPGGLLSGKPGSLSSIFTLEDSLTEHPSAADTTRRRTRRVSRRILSIFHRKPRDRLDKDSSGNESGINLTEVPVVDFSKEKTRRGGRKLFGKILETRGGRKLFPAKPWDAGKLQISQDSGYEGQSSFSSSSSVSSSHSSLLTTEETEFVSSSPLAKIAPRGGSRSLSTVRTLGFHMRSAFLRRRSSRKFKKFSITACETDDITRSMRNLREDSRTENRVSFISDPGTVQVTEEIQESITKSADCVDHIRLNKETCARCATSFTKLTRQIKRRISWGLQSSVERTTEDSRLIEESEDDSTEEINECCVDFHEGAAAEGIEDSLSVNSLERLALNEDLSKLKRRGISKSAAELFESELTAEHGEEIERFDSFSDFSCVRLRNERERRQSFGKGETEDQCVAMDFQDEEDDDERLAKSLYSNSYVLTMYI